MLVLLLVLQRFGHRQWGNISELTTKNHSVTLHPVNADGTLDKGEVGVDFYPEDEIHAGWSLLGRATTVVGARKGGDNRGNTGGECAEAQCKVKDDTVGGAPEKHSEAIQKIQGAASEDTGSADTTKRDPSDPMNHPARAEALHVYDQAREAYRKAYSDLMKAHDLVLKVSWPEASRPEEWRIIEHAQALGKNDKNIEGHIPVVNYARQFDQYSTHHIRDFLGLNLVKGEGSGSRTLRLIVMNRLRPIYDLDGKQFWTVFWQCVACV